MPKAQAVTSSNRNRIILLIIAGLFLYIILPQIGAFRNSFSSVRHADPTYILIALVFSGLTYVAAANTYYLLALSRLRYYRTILAQMASMFINRLLPAGIGSIGANYVYLRKSKHSVAQAASVVSANNLLGVIGHVLLTLLLAFFFSDQLPAINIQSLTRNGLFVIAIIAIIVLVTIILATQKNRFQKRIKQIINQLLAYRHHPVKVGTALLSSISLTLFSIACLYFCMLSFNVHLSFIAVMLIFTLGVAVGTATPTPGGLGGVEAGLIAGFIAAGVSSSTAFAIALTYRFIHYWLSFLIGALAFGVCRKRGYM